MSIRTYKDSFFLLITVFLSTSLWAKTPTTLTLIDVQIPVEYHSFTSKQIHECKTISGAYEGSRVIFKAKTDCRGGRAEHDLTFMLNDSYKRSEKKVDTVVLRGHGCIVTFSVDIPRLADKVPFINQQFTLHTVVTKGRTQKKETTFYTLKISRPIILTRTQGELAQQKNCYHRYPAYKINTTFSNGTTSPSTIEVVKGNMRFWNKRSGYRVGAFAAPIMSLVGGFVAFNTDYFRETSKQVEELQELKINFNIDPGQHYQMYAQETRFFTAFDIKKINICGELEEKVEGGYLYQWWGISEHLHRIDPYSDEEIDPLNVGEPAKNSCSKIFEDQLQLESDRSFIDL